MTTTTIEELKRLSDSWISEVGNNKVEQQKKTNEALEISNSMMEALEAAEVDRKFPYAAMIAVSVWFLLITLVFTLSPEENFERLEGLEQQVPATAAIILAAMFLNHCLPFLRIIWKWKRRPSGVIFSAFVVMSCAITTNVLLAFFPTVVVVDPITKARVFLVRWCEWTPLAGLMTFMSEGVDIPKKKGGFRHAVIFSLLESVSTFCGMIFPFCHSKIAWYSVMIFSMVTYILIFPSVEIKRKRLEQTPKGITFAEREMHDRRHFAYHLLRMCSIVWSVLVAFYFANWLFHVALPLDHWLRGSVVAIGFDTAFDVLSKGFFLRVIVEVHHNVFDIESRVRRQLNELLSIMNAVWDTSSDVIFVSVQKEGKASTLFSPAFSGLMESLPPPTIMKPHGAVGFMLETDTKKSATNMTPSEASFIESGSFSSTEDNLVIAPIDLRSRLTQEATRLVNAAWNRLANDLKNEKSSVLLLHEFIRTDGQTCYCEIKVTRRSGDSLIALVRDVSERHKRFNAEQRAHMEALARQDDAQAVNRFTRHEVKNGLLNGMELCERLQDTFSEVGSKVERRLSNGGTKDHVLEAELVKTSGMIGQVDRVLHEVLDTILAEAMARDVVHECYVPSPAKVELNVVLKASRLGIGTEKRFPLEFPNGEIPPLTLDATMLQYIHRNAISNATKYGRPGGTVSTRVYYDYEEQILRIEVVNEPGFGHRELLAMSEEEANSLVFQQGTRLHYDPNQHNLGSISSGDGAWIMQKCAANMDGKCSIRFQTNKTTLVFRCPAIPCYTSDDVPLVIPETTWGIGVDDSALQRRVLLRILTEIGIKKTRRRVIGLNPEEVRKLEGLIVKILDQDSSSKILVLVDENLDFGLKEGRLLISGSEKIQHILQGLTPERQGRILVMIRSANDSADDIALYRKRAHGFLPKTATTKDLALEHIAPVWRSRFQDELDSEDDSENDENNEGGDLLTKEDLCVIVASVDEMLQYRSFREIPWDHLWSALHLMKGDLMVSKNPYLVWARQLITQMRGPEAPLDFDDKWAAIRHAIQAAIDEQDSFFSTAITDIR